MLLLQTLRQSTHQLESDKEDIAVKCSGMVKEKEVCPGITYKGVVVMVKTPLGSPRNGGDS